MKLMAKNRSYMTYCIQSVSNKIGCDEMSRNMDNNKKFYILFHTEKWENTVIDLISVGFYFANFARTVNLVKSPWKKYNYVT